MDDSGEMSHGGRDSISVFSSEGRPPALMDQEPTLLPDEHVQQHEPSSSSLVCIGTDMYPEAVLQGHADVVKRLLSRDITLLRKKKWGASYTAFHVAAHKGHTDVLKVLADAGERHATGREQGQGRQDATMRGKGHAAHNTFDLHDALPTAQMGQLYTTATLS